jgi:proton-coupled amino acid transporter
LAIIKSVIGPGVLYVPKGFAESGVGLAVPMLIAAFALVAFSSTGMLEIGLRLKQGGYTDLAGKAYGPTGAKVSKVFIVAQQCGICLTYFVFVAHNLQSVIRDYNNIEFSLG